ncbi:LLM class flavin-dependent oxidoreductase [Streptomyces sp. NBRC 109706]|uniref:LLM class flavin-dependent oxidoreductase n=1 Tax=Streptomyces sp. NBRC 109706 TaxID=1550035 RepID=UPI0007842271|nr:LLM class flavin-dependent oxidoreductase [Streptomyces sp. NBRC 109706]
MKLGLNFLPTVGAEVVDGARYYEEVLDLCAAADQWGFSHVKAVEHYFYAWGGYSPDPVAFLSAVAMRTRQVRLVTGAVVPAFSHPVRQAASLALLDNLSGGRLDAGFARAFLPAEFEMFEVPLSESRARFEEGVTAVERLWRDERFRFEGTFHRFGPLPPLLPRPVQRPGPPVFVAATSSPESFTWAGRNGYHLMIIPLVANHARLSGLLAEYRRARAEAGHRSAPRMHVSYHLYVAPDPVEARERAAAHYEAYRELQIEAYSSWEGVESAQYPGYEKMLDAVRSATFDDLHAAGKVIAGDVDEVTDQLAEITRLYPGAEVSVHLRYGSTTHEEALRSVTLLGERVLPRLAGTPTTTGDPGAG